MNKIKKGGFLFLIKIAYRNIFRNLRRSVLCMIAIASAVFISIFFTGFMQGTRDSIIAGTISYETAHISINSKEYEKKRLFNPIWFPIEMNESLSDMIRNINGIDGVEKVMPRIKTYATVQDNNIKNVTLWGIDMEEELQFQNKTHLAYFNMKTKNVNNCLVKGRLPEKNQNECIIGYELAKRMNIGLDDKVTLKVVSSQLSDKFIKPNVVGIFDFDFYDMDKDYIIMSFEKLQKILNLSNKTPLLFIYANDILRTDEIAKSVEKMYRSENLVINKWQDNFRITLFDQSNGMMIIMQIAFIIVASFLIINTIMMVIHERIKEIGMMGALGMSRFEIVIVFFNEAVILSLLGSLIGVLSGALLTFFGSLFPIDSRFFGNSMEVSNTIYIKFSYAILLSGLLYGLIVSAICTIFPSLKSAFIEPVEALRR
jgi:putative ABC transport system permease protein